MSKTLHRVQVVLYVMAEDEFDACGAATRARFDFSECVAKEAESLDPGWEDAIPYHADDDRTCSEILAGKMPADHPRAQSIKSPSSWVVNADGSSMKNSPGKHPWGFGATLLMIRDLMRRLFSLTQQDLKEAGVSVERMWD
jgi:hypothetical protein